MKTIFSMTLLLACVAGATRAAEAQEQLLEVIPDHLAYLYAPEPAEPRNDALQQLFVGKSRRWENGRTLRVCFFSGNPVVVELIRSVASEWNASSGVKLNFGDGDQWLNCMSPKAGFSQIRIGFAERGYWSYLGSDSERYGGERSPSMNLDSFNRTYTEFNNSAKDVVASANAYHKAVIRHEFGHALGLLHEHQHPTLDCTNQIKWEGPDNAYDVYGGEPNFWPRDQIRRNLGFVHATDSDYVAGEPDPKSVMMYSLDRRIFKDTGSKCAVPVNYAISVKDRAIVAKLYPTSGVTAVVSENVADAYVRPAPAFGPNDSGDDYLARTLSDLESDDTATRRNARARLATLVSQPQNASQVSEIVSDLPRQSYRQQLGVSSALANSEKPVVLSPEALRTLESRANSANDATLRDNLQKAKAQVISSPLQL